MQPGNALALAGAELELVEARAVVVSNADGMFEFPILPAWLYTVRIRADVTHDGNLGFVGTVTITVSVTGAIDTALIAVSPESHRGPRRCCTAVSRVNTPDFFES